MVKYSLRSSSEERKKETTSSLDPSASSSGSGSTKPTEVDRIGTVEKIGGKLQRVSDKLLVHEGTTKSLIYEAEDLALELQVMSEYNKAVEEMNLVACRKSRKELVAEIVEDEKEMMRLRKENRELRKYVQDQQKGIDIIMVAYRAQVAKLKTVRDMERQAVLILEHEHRGTMDERNKNKAEMEHVMGMAVVADEKSVKKQNNIVAKLLAENAAMRKLLLEPQEGNKRDEEGMQVIQWVPVPASPPAKVQEPEVRAVVENPEVEHSVAVAVAEVVEELLSRVEKVEIQDLE